MREKKALGPLAAEVPEELPVPSRSLGGLDAEVGEMVILEGGPEEGAELPRASPWEPFPPARGCLPLLCLSLCLSLPLSLSLPPLSLSLPISASPLVCVSLSLSFPLLKEVSWVKYSWESGSNSRVPCGMASVEATAARVGQTPWECKSQSLKVPFHLGPVGAFLQ